MTTEQYISKFGDNSEIIIELGCGPYKKNKSSISIDIYKDDNIDIVHDLNNGLDFIPDNSVDYISSRHLLEHIEQIDFLIKEIYRILKPGGKHIVIVPHFSNPFYYSDITHKNFFGLYTFDYYTNKTNLKRKVPMFYNDLNFNIQNRKLEFRSRLLLMKPFKRILTRLVNLSSGSQEVYEESFSSFIHCSEIKFELIKP